MTTLTTSTVSSDADALDQAATIIATPRVEEGDSFILHVPLEVLARTGLLTVASPDARADIRARIANVVHTYTNWGNPVDRQPNHPDALTANADRVLVQALRTGDLDTVDDAITWLAAHLDIFDLISALAPKVLPSLAAAAHGPILLHLLPRVAARSLPAAAMARTTIHELARYPTWNLSWFTSPDSNRPIPHPTPPTRTGSPESWNADWPTPTYPTSRRACSSTQPCPQPNGPASQPTPWPISPPA